jgi:N-acetylneuraminate synthase
MGGNMEINEVFSDDSVSPYIIAEIGVNHEGSLDTAKALVKSAWQGGANAVKFQTYKADKIAVQNSPAYWDRKLESTDSQYKLFKKYDSFNYEEFNVLASYCREIGINFLSTPFDIESADYLAPMMSAIKISSSDITNRPFIEHLCGYGKPIVLSTGASYFYEIAQAVEWISEFDLPLSLLHCILSYPTVEADANLSRISYLQQRFPDIPIGYSDHTLPDDMEVCTIAAVLGARIIEKHFTNDKTLPGNDHYHAMDCDDLKRLRQRISRINRVMGTQTSRLIPAEAQARDHARRSLVTARPVVEGSIIRMADLTFKRPASGISPRAIGEVVGRTAARTISADTILQWSHIS